jgi:hypothetical protein
LLTAGEELFELLLVDLGVTAGLDVASTNLDATVLSITMGFNASPLPVKSAASR